MLSTLTHGQTTFKVYDENIPSILSKLDKIKPPAPTFNRKGLGVRVPVWEPGMMTKEYICNFEELNLLVKGGYVFEDRVAATYNPDIPLLEILPDDPDYVAPVPTVNRKIARHGLGAD